MQNFMLIVLPEKIQEEFQRKKKLNLSVTTDQTKFKFLLEDAQ